MNYIIYMERSAIAFFILFLLVRFLGKRQIGQFSFFHYVVGISIGSVAASISIDRTVPLGLGVTSLILWGLLSLGVAYLVLNMGRSRGFLIGVPTIIIREGKILQDAMSRLRLDMDELSMLLRREKIFDITDVDYAVFESDGKLSVLKRVERQNVTRKDLNLPAPALKYMPAELIVDGQVVEKNLKEFKITRSWLEEQTRSQGYNGLDDIFYAELLSDGSVYFSPKDIP